MRLFDERDVNSDVNSDANSVAQTTIGKIMLYLVPNDPLKAESKPYFLNSQKIEFELQQSLKKLEGLAQSGSLSTISKDNLRKVMVDLSVHGPQKVPQQYILAYCESNNLTEEHPFLGDLATFVSEINDAWKLQHNGSAGVNLVAGTVEYHTANQNSFPVI